MLKRVCPFCYEEFGRAKVIDKIRHCPLCGVAVHYRADGRVVPYDEKAAIDKAIAIVNCHLKADLTEAMPRERKFLYDLLDYMRKWLKDRPLDLGKSVYDFLVAFVSWVTEDKYWGQVIESARTILVIYNNKSRLIERYFQVLYEESTYFDDPEFAVAEKLAELRVKLNLMLEGAV